jgi:TPR repeat protein
MMTGGILLAWAGYERSEEAARRRVEDIERTVTSGSPEASRAAGIAHAARKENSPFDETLAAAKGGDPVAQFKLGEMYRDGKRGGPQPQGNEPGAAAVRSANHAQAAIWFRAAAEQGYAPAQNALGLMYKNGSIASPEPLAQAAAWFGKAAEQGDAAARINLGEMLWLGMGVATDTPKAVELFRKAAEQGQRSALSDLHAIANGNGIHAGQAGFYQAETAFILGQLYMQGRGIDKDEREAVKWFAKAIKLGHEPARQWLDKAAEGGDVSVQYLLGQLYLGREGGEKDEAQAAAWFKKAAERGYAPAQNMLGAMYGNGLGMAKDEAQARAWFEKAAAQGNLDGKYGLRQMELRAQNMVALASASDAQPEAIEKAVQAIWEQRNQAAAPDAPTSPLCIAMPSSPEPDARSKARQPMAWHLDFFAGSVADERRAKALRQLNVLAAAGLLNKQDVMLNVNGAMKQATRYSLSEDGWALSGGGAYSRSMPCFIYGTARYLGLTRFAPRTVRMTMDQAALQLIEAHARVGLASEADLAPWARDPELQAEFPDIGKNLAGQDFAVLLARRGNELVGYTEAEKRRRNPEIVNRNDPVLASLRAEAQRAKDDGGDLPPPTVDEIKRLLEASHGVGKSEPWPIPCIYLPGGSSKLPVDKELNQSGQRRPYAVAIFRNKERTAYDRVANKTIPYLNTLERLGILQKRAESGIPGGNKADSGRVFDADIYELAPTYVTLIHPRYTCFPLGPPTVEFVDVQIFDKGDLSDPAFTYKLKVLYKNPPTWMNSPSLQNGWRELKGALDNGMACEGKMHFDRKKRQSQNGGGSCWWAFDSYENDY